MKWIKSTVKNLSSLLLFLVGLYGSQFFPWLQSLIASLSKTQFGIACAVVLYFTYTYIENKFK